MRKFTILAALLLLAPAVSQAKTLEELLVEKGVITKSEARASAGSGAAKVYWNEGTRLEFDNGFTTKVATLLRPRYTFTDNDDGISNNSSFSVENARLLIAGTAVNNEFSYKLLTDFVGAGGDGEAKSTSLLDAWIQWQACDSASVRLGQFKTQGGRQFNTDEAMLQFADRTDVAEYFALGRQAGVMAATNGGDGEWELSAGLFNGESTGEGKNLDGVDTKHTFVLAGRWNAMGSMNAFSEGDVENTEGDALSVGASWSFSDKPQTAGGVTDDTDRSTITADVTYKSQGLSVAGEYFYFNEDSDANGETKPTGFYVQAGYFLTPKEMELAARYGWLDYDNGDQESSQASATFNYYWWAHHTKAQVGVEFLSDDDTAGNSTDTTKWIVQLVSWF